MKVVILCGGQGTRIRDASDVLPKPMLPIGEKPIVWHIMKGFAAHGLTDFVLCLGYKGWLIKEFFLNYRAMTCDVQVDLGRGTHQVLGGPPEANWNVVLAETGLATMTGGRVARVRPYLEGADLFLMTYGDGVADVDIRKLIAFHRAHGRIATVTAVRPQGRFGELRIDETSVREFNEKPHATEGFINGGFFVCDAKRVWDYVNDNPSTVWEREPMQRLAHDDQLRAYKHGGYWQPMDTLREFNLLNDLWNSGNAPWKTWGD